MGEQISVKQRSKKILKSLLPSIAIDIYHFLKFFYVQRIKGFEVPSSPHFDAVSTPYFISRLESAQHYLEYGSGGSTFLAAQQAKNFTTVDSDAFFLSAVRQKIGRSGFDAAGNVLQEYLFADIGLTKAWGVPVWTKQTNARLSKWLNYSMCPWKNQARAFLPDLILVDGRFRVACALATINQLRGKNDWELLVDDYDGRPYYREIERFAVLEKLVGRMAVFKPKAELDLTALKKSIELHAADWR